MLVASVSILRSVSDLSLEEEGAKSCSGHIGWCEWVFCWIGQGGGGYLCMEG